MRFLPVIVIVAVYAHSAVAGDPFNCYTCEDDNCRSVDIMGIVRCYVDGDATEEDGLGSRVRRATAPDGTGYACYTVRYKDESSASRIKKGCVVIPVEESACTVINMELGIDETEKCDICLNDKCNSSATIQFSILTMTVLLCGRYLM